MLHAGWIQRKSPDIEAAVGELQLLAVSDGILDVEIARLRAGSRRVDQVLARKNPRFYTRTSNGAHPLDVHELRYAFLRSESIVERVRQFRLERLVRIAVDETPAVLRGRARLVFHLIPLSGTGHGGLLDVRLLDSAAEKLSPMSPNGWSRRFNLDGLVVFDVPRDEGVGGTRLRGMILNEEPGGSHVYGCVIVSPLRPDEVGIIGSPRAVRIDGFRGYGFWAFGLC